MKMGHLERALERLRLLILGSNTWDFCVVWKIGDDPSRFIEWVGCCCNGGGNQELGNKKKKRLKLGSFSDCRDANFVHPANTKSCETLARLPPFMSLYSGVHGEVVISGQARWIKCDNASDSKTLTEEFEGTRVLIPVVGGLVELFSAKQIPENGSMIEYVKAQLTSSEIETLSNSTVSFDGPYADPLLEKSTDSCPSSLFPLQILSLSHPLIPIPHNRNDSTFAGSSAGSLHLDERPSLNSTHCSSTAPQTIPFIPLSSCHEEATAVSEQTDGGQKEEKKPCKSKNLVSERKRRKRINDGMLILRSIVPKITKMNKTATLSDAIDYIEELHGERRKLLDELQDSSDENTDDSKASCLDGEIMESRGLVTSQAQVQVNQLGPGSYLLRIVCLHRPGVFSSLLEALGSLNVIVDDVHATVCNGTIASDFFIQTDEDVQEKDLRDLLVLLFQ